MIRSLLARRLVTGVSIVMLLLCQTAAAALACVAPPPAVSAQVVAIDAASPCQHNALDADNSAPDHGCQDRCPSRDSSSATAKVNIPAVDSLALPVLTVAPLHAAITITAPVDRILACAAPLPLILVYCRLLI